MTQKPPSPPWSDFSFEKPCAVALGLFDGVHIGHREIFERTRRAAQTLGIDSAVFSFQNHPRSVVRNSDSPPSPRFLVTPERRYHLMREAGIEQVLSPRFTLDWANTPAEEFAQRFLAETLNAKHVVVGFNYCFGRKAEGRPPQLVEFGRDFGYEVEVVPAFTYGGIEVSSTRIRESIIKGDLAGARELLDRPHELAGTVVRGEGRGRKLGFPTANLSPDLPPLLPQGVYAVRVFRREGDAETRLPDGMFFLGPRKTFGEAADRTSVEVHLFDYEGDLYGRYLRLEIIEKVREGVRFESPQALVEQLEKDRERCLAILENER